MKTNQAVDAGMPVVDRPRGRLQPTPQGQRVRPVIDTWLAPFTQVMEFDLDLFPGQAGWVHRHEYVTPLVRMGRGGPVATLIGEKLERVVWIKPGQRAAIDGQEPHLCVYPRRHVGGLVLPRWTQRHAKGSETRNARTLEEDTERLPDLWPIAFERIAELGWHVSYPDDLPDGLVPPPCARCGQ